MPSSDQTDADRQLKRQSPTFALCCCVLSLVLNAAIREQSPSEVSKAIWPTSLMLKKGTKNTACKKQVAGKFRYAVWQSALIGCCLNAHTRFILIIHLRLYLWLWHLHADGLIIYDELSSDSHFYPWWNNSAANAGLWFALTQEWKSIKIYQNGFKLTNLWKPSICIVYVVCDNTIG